jgi:hypothetical protein
LDERFGELRLCALARGEPLAQVGAEAAEFFDAGDDAGLLGEGRDCDQKFGLCLLVELGHLLAVLGNLDLIQEWLAQDVQEQVGRIKWRFDGVHVRTA